MPLKFANWCDIFWVCLQLTLSSSFVIDWVFTVGASIMTQVPFWSFRRRAQYPSWSRSAILFSFLQLMSPGLEWPIGIRCFNLIQCPYSVAKQGDVAWDLLAAMFLTKWKGHVNCMNRGTIRMKQRAKMERGLTEVKSWVPVISEAACFYSLYGQYMSLLILLDLHC